MKTCGEAGGRNARGEACGSSLGLCESGLCRFHDPELAAEVLAMRQAGGRATAGSRRTARAALPANVPRAPETLQDAVAWSSWAMRAVAVGEIDARTGHEIGYLVNAFKAAVEKRDLQREIEELRAELAAARRRQGRPPAT